MNCTETNPRVNILIPTFNRAIFLKQAIDSALNQDYSNLEVIVSDNASSDNTQDIIDKYLGIPNFKYFRNETNVGMVANWRKLLYDYCTGDWAIILSDDDYFIYNSYISEAIKLIQKDKSILMVYACGYVSDLTDNKFLKLELPYEEINDGKVIFLNRDLLLKPPDFTLCNVLFNVNIAKQLKAFSNLNNICCDSELFLNICLCGSIGVVKKYVTVYRYHSGNLILKERTPDELIAMFDMYINPYHLALNMKCFQHYDLTKWKDRVLKNLFKYAIKQLIFFNRKSLASTFNIMCSICNYNAIYIIIIFISDPLVWKKLFLYFKNQL